MKKLFSLFLCSLFLGLIPLQASEPSSSQEETPITVTPESDAPHISQAEYGKQFTKTLIAIIIIVVVAIATIWLLKKFAVKRPLQLNHNKNIKILERRHLSPNTCLYHIEVGGKQFILAESKFHIKNVLTIDWTEEDSE